MLLIDALSNKTELNEYIESTHYFDVAKELEELDIEQQFDLYNSIDHYDFANILIECNYETIFEIVEYLSVDELLSIICEMKSDDAIDVLGYTSFGKQKDVVRRLKKDDREEYMMLLGYDRDSAGGLMSTEFVALKGNMTINAALHKIRNIDVDSDKYIDIIYIVNSKKKLTGFISLKKIILADEEETLENLANDNVISVLASESQEEVVELVQKYDLTALPVVNNRDVLIGIVTVDDAIDALIEEQSDDYLKLGGVVEGVDSQSTILASIKSRLPWLSLNLVTAFLAAFVVSRFTEVISEVVLLAAAMPIVAGMGGNAGTQSLSVMIRNIALNEASLSTEWKKAHREIFVGFINGIVVGTIAAIAISLLSGNIFLGVVLLLAMVGNMMMAVFVGSVVPLLLEKFGFDPALASSIFITTATDIFGFFLFLGLATIFIDYLK